LRGLRLLLRGAHCFDSRCLFAGRSRFSNWLLNLFFLIFFFLITFLFVTNEFSFIIFFLVSSVRFKESADMESTVSLDKQSDLVEEGDEYIDSDLRFLLCELNYQKFLIIFLEPQ